MKDYRHLIHVAATFVLVFVLFLTARSILKPSSYGKIGRYRAASVDEIKALPIKFAGRTAQKECAACHEKEYKDKASGRHKGLNCETCHGPAAAHVAGPASVKPPKPAEAEIVKFCLRCHAPSMAKPRKFPQVDPLKHNVGTACTACHTPHSPRL